MILVTGATGFIGRTLVKSLCSLGSSPLRCLLRSPARERVLQGYPVEFSVGDVTNPPSLREALRGVDRVIHAVGIIREAKGSSFNEINYLGTKNVVQAAKAGGVKHIVHLSAIGVGQDLSLRYGHTKWLGEQEVMASGIPYTIFRPSIQFGEGDEFINTLAGLIKSFPIVPISGSGKNRFQPIHVEDTAYCVAKAALSDKYYNRLIEIGGPEHLTYDQIVDVIALEYKVRRFKVHVPLPIMSALLAVMAVVLPRSPATREQLRYLKIDNVTDLDSVENEFGIRPRALKGNISYIRKITFSDALKMSLGFVPKHIREH